MRVCTAPSLEVLELLWRAAVAEPSVRLEADALASDALGARETELLDEGIGRTLADCKQSCAPGQSLGEGTRSLSEQHVQVYATTWSDVP
jgi:hypothetical protein